MTITTYEGVVEKGKIRLKTGIHLPEKTRVYVIVAEADAKKVARVPSPRLAHRQQAADFTMEVGEENLDAGIQR